MNEGKLRNEGKEGGYEGREASLRKEGRKEGKE